MSIRVLEQAAEFAEIGAGLQLGPNATRLLQQWGLGEALESQAGRPQALRILDAQDGRELGRMTLGSEFRHRYGADYLTMHRADLHRALFMALDRQQVTLHPGTRLNKVIHAPGSVQLETDDGRSFKASALLACDGVWSRTREQVLADGPASATGHFAYRTTLDAAMLPAPALAQLLTAWLGPRMHAVAYPLRSGQLLNLVVIRQTETRAGAQHELGWNRRAEAHWWRDLGRVHGSLRALLELATDWRVWPLFDRPSLDSADQMASGRVALLGDAAHPMRPYLAQGAAMALEDAQALAVALAEHGGDPVPAFRHYALRRWRRNARVQRTSMRNGWIFHASGPLRWARNLAMRHAGSRLLDSPWLYDN